MERFRRSMVIGYEEWHEGVPYELDALDELDAAERLEVEELLLARAAHDWRDVQALDRLGSERALNALEKALRVPDLNVRIEAAMCLAQRKSLSGPRLEELILEALDRATILNGMTKTLAFARKHLSATIVRKLLWCAEHGNDDVRVHAAALVHHLFRRAKSDFDWDKRPFYLRFASNDARERHAAYLELCQDIGVDPNALERITWPLPRRRASKA